MRDSPPGSLLLSVGVGDVIHVGQTGALAVLARDGGWFTLEWRRTSFAPPVTRRLSEGYGMPLEGERARIKLEPRKGSRARIRVVADGAVRIRMERPAELTA